MGVDPPLQPTGPACEAEVPRRIHVEVPNLGEDVIFRYDTLTWNPPLPSETFVQAPREGLPMVRVTCED